MPTRSHDPGRPHATSTFCIAADKSSWDSTQKRLKALLDAAAVHPDAQVREAAERLRKALLLGAGEAQTKLKYQQEVDFGRQQVELASSSQVAADIALIGLGSVIDDIRDTTEALANAIGHGTSPQILSKQLQAATTSCRATFASVATDLAWIIDHGTLDINRARATKLRAPLEALAARYPAPSTTTTPAETDDDATPAADDDTPVA